MKAEGGNYTTRSTNSEMVRYVDMFVISVILNEKFGKDLEYYRLRTEKSLINFQLYY